MRRFFFLSALLAALCVNDVWADKPPTADFDRTQALRISQSAIGKPVGDYYFFDRKGQQQRLANYRGKPLVVSLIYTACFHICPTTTKHLHKVVDKAQSVLGEGSFNVITVGFDTTRDTADAMRIYAKQHSVDEDYWDFLSTDRDTIAKLAQDLGFLYYPSPNGFDHLVQSSVIDGSGVVYRQIYGIRFDTPHLIEPLKQLVFGEKPQQSFLQNITDKIRLFCTVYDPYSDTYHFDYSVFVGLFIGLVLGGFMVYLLVREWRHSNTTRKKS